MAACERRAPRAPGSVEMSAGVGQRRLGGAATRSSETGGLAASARQCDLDMRI